MCSNFCHVLRLKLVKNNANLPARITIYTILWILNSLKEKRDPGG